MSEHYPKVLIIDMLYAIDAVLEFSSGMVYEAYLNDRKTRDAIYRNIMMLGETSHRLPEYFMQAHP